MLSILLIDDSDDKIRELKSLIRSHFAVFHDSVDIADSKNVALDKLYNKQYDLVLLDVCLPNEKGDDALCNNGIDLLDLIKNDDSIQKPAHVIGITEYELQPEQINLFSDTMFFLLKYDACSDVWRKQLMNLIDYQIKYKRMTKKVNDYIYDVAIINALQSPENEVLRRVFSDKWDKVDISEDKCTTYYETKIELESKETIKVVTCYANQMACIASAALTTKVLFHFRPRYLFMTGIAAAVDENEVALGDVLIAKEVWDGASGKIKDLGNNEAVFQPDYRHIPIDNALLNIVNQIKDDNECLQQIYNNYQIKTGRPNTQLSIHTGPMASVPAVLACEAEIEKIKAHSRKLLGVEMESYGMYYAASNSIEPRPKFFASLKSASDYATNHKSDDYQEYASYTSAAVLLKLLNMLSYK